MKNANIHIYPHVSHVCFDTGETVTIQGGEKAIAHATKALARGLRSLNRSARVIVSEYDAQGQKIATK